MKMCFISHCSDDKEQIVEDLEKILSQHFPKDQFRFFCSSTTSHPLHLGEAVDFGLKNKLKTCTCMISIVTDNYLRSPVCLTELSAMWYKSESDSTSSQTIPIVFTPLGRSFFQTEFVSNLNYMDATNCQNAQNNAAKLYDSFLSAGFHPTNKDAFLAALTVFFETAMQPPSFRPYIGSGDSYENINKFCTEKGVTHISSGVVDHKMIYENFAGKQDLYFVMTTGSSFIDIYSKEFLQSLVAQGTSIYMILPNRRSDFCADVAFIEDLKNNNPNEDRLTSLTSEFDAVVGKLKLVLREAKEKAQNPDRIGHVFICASYTLLRQTIGLAKAEDGTCWGWISTTIPPVRASGNTPTIIFKGNLKEDTFFGKEIYAHVAGLVEVARLRHGLIDLAVSPNFTSFREDDVIDLGERSEIAQQWKEKYAQARSFMARRQRHKNEVLIEIAAQHPLDGEKPGEEFRARLDYGFQLYQKLVQEGKEVFIYIPGSVHMTDGVADPVSLSEAGCRYLMEQGVPEECLFGDKENEEYMGSNGVYNSCDECFVSSRIFDENGFGTLHCVCSQNQAMRKQLFYLNFQVIPVIHTVQAGVMYHDFIQEILHSIPKVIYRYPNWSIPSCPFFHTSRIERKPSYQLPDTYETPSEVIGLV